MFRFNAKTETPALRSLSADEINLVAGGNKIDSEGRGCTDPRPPIKGTPPTKPIGPVEIVVY